MKSVFDAIDDAAVGAVAGGREHQRERHLEGLGHFEAVEGQRERQGDQSDHGRDAIAGGDEIIVQAADHLDLFARQADLLFGLAQRGLDRGAVARVEPPAGKADLPGVIVEVVGATDDTAGAATQLETLDIADTTLNPGWYRIGFCAQDASDHDMEVHVVHADNLLVLGAGAATGEMFATGTACTAGDPAATTGALTADASAVNFMLRVQ